MSTKEVLEAQRKEDINRRLIESGEKERLKEEFRQELERSGWHDKIRRRCQDFISGKSLSEISNNILIDEIRKSAKADITDEMKSGLLQRIKSFIESSKEQE
jgi:enhancer of yellow 2 transcription factor